MITQDIFDFLKDLKENNNKDWFTNNKPTFEKEQKKSQRVFQ